MTGSAALAADPLPEAIAASGETAVLTVHGVGAQVYECKPVTDGKLAWSFREPIATLIEGGRTVGRHHAGRTGSMSTAAPSPAAPPAPRPAPAHRISPG